MVAVSLNHVSLLPVKIKERGLFLYTSIVNGIDSPKAMTKRMDQKSENEVA